jgi:hypothetical protein
MLNNSAGDAGPTSLDDSQQAAAPAAVPDLDTPATPRQSTGDPYQDLLALDNAQADSGTESASATQAAPTQAQPRQTAPAQPQTPAQTQQTNSRAPKLQQITDPAMREMLAQMSNAAFNKFYELALRVQNGDLLEKATHEKTLADREKDWTSKLTNTRFLDHEDGYKLTPEFVELDTAAKSIAGESQFWEYQLSNIRQGLPVRTLVIDEKGNVRPSDYEIDPKQDPGIEGKVLSKIARASGIEQNIQAQMRGLPERHKTEFTKLNEHVVAMNKSMFGALLQNPQFTKAAEGEIAGIPAALRGRPEMQLLGNALAAGKLLLAKNEQLAAENAKLKNVRGARAAASPDPDDTARTTPEADGDASADLRALDRMASGA